jgi:hypothetical protein
MGADRRPLEKILGRSTFDLLSLPPTFLLALGLMLTFAALYNPPRA